MEIGEHFLEDAIGTLRRYKALAERAITQLDDAQVHRVPEGGSNSVAILVKHLAGNMRSRWSEYLASDGEKESRDRDGEFVDDFHSREELMRVWEEGWRAVFSALEPLTGADVLRSAPVRGRDHTVVQAVLRQLGHYAYHVGQIVQLARTWRGDAWEWLSIAPGKSAGYRPEGRI